MGLPPSLGLHKLFSGGIDFWLLSSWLSRESVELRLRDTLKSKGSSVDVDLGSGSCRGETETMSIDFCKIRKKIRVLIKYFCECNEFKLKICITSNFQGA